MEAMIILTFVFVGLFGLVVGSFLNVLIYRLPRHIFFSSARSFCPNCKTKLKWFELIPLFSWIFLGGKCRTCKAKISFRYPLVEMSNAFLWLLCYFFHGFQVQTFIYMIACSVLLVITFIDIDTTEVPNGLSLTLAVLGLVSTVVAVFLPHGILWWEHLLGGAVIGGVFLLIVLLTGGRGMGMGDVKVMFGVGLIFGWKLGLVAMMFGFVIGGITGVILLLSKSANGKTEMPLCPSLALGVFAAVAFGNYIVNWYGNIISGLFQ